MGRMGSRGASCWGRGPSLKCVYKRVLLFFGCFWGFDSRRQHSFSLQAYCILLFDHTTLENTLRSPNLLPARDRL